MATTYTLTHGMTSDGASAPLSGSGIEVGGTDISIDQTLAASTTDAAVSMSFTTAGLQALELIASVDMTLETNSGTSPGNTINLKAGRPFVWERSPGYFANPFTVDVTGFFFTTTQAGRVRGRVLVT